MSNGTVMSYSRAKGCSLQCKVEMLSTVALAMQYLHEHHPPVIHGDIKGVNILVSEDERCCLGDFGLSMLEHNTENKIYRSTSQAQGRGSIPWLAPELMNPDEVGATNRVTRDIYAFGCTIFEIVTGSAPFSEKKLDIQIMMDVLKGARPKRPDTATCPDWLWDLVEMCWAEDVSTRPTAREVARRLSGGGLREGSKLVPAQRRSSYSASSGRIGERLSRRLSEPTDEVVGGSGGEGLREQSRQGILPGRAQRTSKRKARAENANEETETSPKRKRGRPPKSQNQFPHQYDLNQGGKMDAKTESIESLERTPAKRGRGRPKGSRNRRPDQERLNVSRHPKSAVQRHGNSETTNKRSHGRKMACYPCRRRKYEPEPRGSIVAFCAEVRDHDGSPTWSDTDLTAWGEYRGSPTWFDTDLLTAWREYRARRCGGYTDIML
ncbi:hypothetical protein WG66_014376 [Moniliophthora roreri]|nr:hypothetical protein WG66_014376 [Moniliophthora roreri]